MSQSAAHDRLRGFASPRLSSAEVIRAGDGDDVSDVLGRSDAGAVIARGAGRNYGDAADNSGGSVLLLDGDAPLDVDERGLLTVGGGATLGSILERVHPLGWTLPVVPATRHVTVGGAIASDVHGKNHLTAGSFGRHVRSVLLATPNGDHVVTPASDPDLLTATSGGMGLTGIVTAATIQLRRADTAWLMARHHVCASLDDVLATMATVDGDFRIGWLDAFATGRQLGRGYVVEARWADTDELIGAARQQPRTVRWRRFGTIPERGMPRLLHDPAVRGLNRAWLARARRRHAETPVRFDAVLMPLDALEGWNRLYGRHGFVQYQFAVPDEGVEFIRMCLDRLARAGCLSYFTTMKRLGPASGAFLSFARPGWSLSLDIPRRAPGLDRLLHELDDELVAAGGRIYLAKDSRMDPRHVERMYPLEEFRAVKRRIDPDDVLQSDLSRRLRIVDSRNRSADD